jgi:asparagine synthase (glutamine-hydrolysing)
MCGICGELRFDGAPVRDEVIVSMREVLHHRGPDDGGLFVSDDRRAGLGFRRLRIVDLHPRANQPMANEDGAIRLVFNGEIYNFLDLRRELEPRGHIFRSDSDTETIVHLYEEYGLDAIERLEGMFALALWDGRTGRLILARDRAGKKPLFYRRDARHIVFASEIKSLMRHPDVSIEIDPSAVPLYFLHGYVPAPATHYRGIEQLPPASMLVVERNGMMRQRQFWSVKYPAQAEMRDRRPPDRAEARATVRTLLTRAVERRLLADVPLGAFLSGGVDSTIVVGLMSQLTGTPVRTFSIGFEGDAQYDETEYARLVSQRFGTTHTEFRVEPHAVGLVDELIWHHDGAFGDASAIPTFIVSKLTREHVTVVLTGDGGDELFAGYRRFPAAIAAERIPSAVAALGGWVLDRIGAPKRPRHPLGDLRRFLGSVNLPWLQRMTRLSSIFYDELDELLLPELGRVDRLTYLKPILERMPAETPLGQLLDANFQSYLPDDLLVKTDRCTMANALEARAPFLDRELTEYVAGLPDDCKLRGRETKVILREAFADLLPREVTNRPKMGFGVPLDSWFRGELREQLCDELLASDARYRDYLHAPKVHELVHRHHAGRAHLGLQLWTILCFERWLRLLPAWTAARTAPAALGLSR